MERSGVKGVCVDEKIRSIYEESIITIFEDVHISPNSVGDCFGSEIHAFGSVRSSLGSKCSYEDTDYSSGSSLEEFKDTADEFHGEADAKRRDEKDEKLLLPSVNGDCNSVELVSLARLLQEERERNAVNLEQESRTKELIPLEEFSRKHCDLCSSDSDAHLNLNGGIAAICSGPPLSAEVIKDIYELERSSAHSSEISLDGKHADGSTASSDHPAQAPCSSGNISLRSEGSATSARSFAFPVLQSEWSGSPVTMARADRRRLRSHRRWGSELLCCKF